MKKLIKLVLLAVVACSVLSACIVVPVGGGGPRYHDHYRGDYYGR